MKTKLAAAALVMAAGSAARAQVLDWTQRVHPLESDWNHGETAIVASRGDPEVVVAWIRAQGNSAEGVWYNVLNGGGLGTASGSFNAAAAAEIPVPTGSDGVVEDPFVAYSRVDGTVWIGGQHEPRHLYVARKKFGVALETAVPVALDSLWQEDKPLAVVGPVFGGGDERMHILHTRYDGERMWGITSDSSPLGASWTHPEYVVGPAVDGNNTPIGNVGSGACPVVLANDSAHPGRLVVAFRPQDPTNFSGYLPQVTFTNDGTLWSQPFQFSQAWIPGGVTFEPIDGVPEDSYESRFENFPSVSVHPLHPDEVYVAFSAIQDSGSDPENADIIIAKSTDGGATFFASTEGDQTLRLRDSDLGEDAGTRQVMPWISVDEEGGINILYYAEKPPSGLNPWKYQAKYARVTNFNPQGTLSIAVLPLAESFDLQNVPNYADIGLGDYVMIDSRPCEAFVAFASRHETPTGTISIYVSRIKTCGVDTLCYANCDGSTTTPILNVQDFTCFLQKFANGDSYANCDGSTGSPVLNVQDFTCFLQKYAMGCN